MQLEGSNRDLPLGIDRGTTIADISTSICFKYLIFTILIDSAENERLDGNVKTVAFNSDLGHPLVACSVLLKVMSTPLMLRYLTPSGLSTCPMRAVNPTLSYINQSISYIIRIDISDFVLFLSGTVVQINDTLDPQCIDSVSESCSVPSSGTAEGPN
jgi:hypothetical protein